jgi:hypothetical protein
MFCKKRESFTNVSDETHRWQCTIEIFWRTIEIFHIAINMDKSVMNSGDKENVTSSAFEWNY